MKKIILSIFSSIFFIGLVQAQVGIGTTDPKATLDVQAVKTDGTTAEGIIAPRLSLQQLASKDAQYTLAQTGALVFVNDLTGSTTAKTVNVTKTGYYFFTGTLWQGFDLPAWNLTGNSGTNKATNFIGTTDDNDLLFKRNNILAGYLGGSGGGAATNNTSFGVGALVLSNNNIGFNTAIGTNSMAANTSGTNNAALGYTSLANNTTGSNNTAVGRNAASGLTTGSNSIAIGANTALAAGTSNQMNIGNLIFGTNMTGTYAAPAGNIGIGTTAPATKLHIAGDLTVGTAVPTNINVSRMVRNTSTGLVGVAPLLVAVTKSVAVGDTAMVDIRSMSVGINSMNVSATNACGKNMYSSFNLVETSPTEFGGSLTYLNGMGAEGAGTGLRINGYKFQVKFSGVTPCPSGGDDTQFNFIIDAATPGKLIISNGGNVPMSYTVKIFPTL